MKSSLLISGELTRDEFELVKLKIVEELGCEPIEAVGYHIAIHLYERKETDNYYIDKETGERKKSLIALPKTTTSEDKWSQCVGKVIYLGDEAYKTGKFRQDRSFMNFSNYNEFLTACELIERSKFCPEKYKGNLADIVSVVELGARHGFAPMESLLKIDISKDGVPFIKEEDEHQEEIKNNIFSFIRENKTKPWCVLGDWVVVPRHEGILINYQEKPIMLVPDDRIVAKVKEPFHVTRY